MFQNQIQEDFLSEFDTTLSAKDKFIQKPRSFALGDFTDTTINEKPIKRDFKEFMTQFDNEGDLDCDLCVKRLSFLEKKLNFGIEKGTAFLTCLIEKELSRDILHFLAGVEINAGHFVYNLPKYEEELTVLTSACLFFYGGSWVRLAAIIAATELFDTKQVLNEAYEVGWKFMCAEGLDDQEDVTPFQVTKAMRNVGMHFALVLSVLHCEAWAEICITFAIARKLSTIVRLEEFLDDGGVDLYSAAEIEWFELLSHISCAAMSLILLGVSPGLITAMYMAFVGIQCFFTGRYQLCLPTGSFTSKPYVFLTSEDYLDNKHQFSIWASVIFSGLWQAYYSYNGLCQYFSWLMFLLPAVKFFNIISSYFTFDLSTLKLH